MTSSTRWKNWLVPVTVVQDTLYDIPRDVVACWWQKVRPDILLKDKDWKSKVDPEGNINAKAFRLGNTGYIQQIKLFISEESPSVSVLTFRGLCHAQMKPNVYNIQLVMRVRDQTAKSVEASSCNCICGKELGANALCKHLIALVYALKTVIEVGTIPHWPWVPCTSEEQKWGVKPSDKITLRPDRATMVYFLHPGRRAEWQPWTKSKLPPAYRCRDDEQRAELVSRVQKKTGVVYPEGLVRLLRKPGAVPRQRSPTPVNPFGVQGFKVWPADVPCLPLPSSATATWKSIAVGMNPGLLRFFERRVVVTVEGAVKIEQLSRKQSESVDWAFHRSLRLTSTSSKNATTAIKNVSAGIQERRTRQAKEMLKVRDLSGVPAIARGRELEPVAIRFFVDVMNKNGYTLEHFPVGFVVHPIEPWLGASPDGYLRVEDPSGNKFWALLEVKTFDVNKTLNDVGHLKEEADQSGEKNFVVKKSHLYYYQIQTAMLCAGLVKSYLITFCGEQFQNHITEVLYDETVCSLILSNGVQFDFNYMLPEIFSRNKA